MSHRGVRFTETCECKRAALILPQQLRQLGDIRRDPPRQTFQNKGMRRHQPKFIDGIYALIALAVIAWPLWVLAKYLMDKLGCFSLHPLASQIISFLILGWAALVIISAAIAAIRDHQERFADLGFALFVIVIVYIAVTLTLSQIYLQNRR
jgi:hypothetical protein